MTSIEMELIEMEFEIECSECGNSLDATTSRGSSRLKVDLCDYCFDKKKDKDAEIDYLNEKIEDEVKYAKDLIVAKDIEIEALMIELTFNKLKKNEICIMKI